MRRFLAILIFISLATSSFGRGGAGVYYISGTVYGKCHNVLKNIELSVKIGDSTNIIKTNEFGQFEIKVEWMSPCISSRCAKRHKKHLRKLFNPMFIYISYGDKKIKIKNLWEKYGSEYFESKDQITWKKDLEFI